MLREYQERAIGNTRQAFIDGCIRVCLVAPTGAGKTTIGAELGRLKTSYGRRTVWIAHRDELIDQAAGRLELFGLPVGVIAASSNRTINPHRPVQVASIQTLAARGQAPPADLVIWDEAHRSGAQTYRDLFARYPDAQHVGLTATPERADGRPLGEFERLIEVAKYSELLAGGWIVPCEVVRPNKPLKPGEIAQRPVDAYLTHTPGQLALVFSPTREAAEKHAAEFTTAGVTAAVIDGGTPKGTRRQLLDSFRAGDTQVLVNCGVFTEGTDLPMCSVVILARGCGTEGLYIQITGRALRPYPGKTHATLIDLRGVSHIHGSPTEDRVYSLDGPAGIRRASEPNPYPACLVCGAPKEPGTACSECGTAPRSTELTITGDELCKWSGWRQKPDDERARTLARWLRKAREKGWQDGSAAWKYKGVFGSFPPADVMAMAKALLK